MTASTIVRPPEPAAPPAGLVYMAVPDEEWRISDAGAKCRWTAPGSGSCGDDAVADKSVPANPIWPWWSYCAVHARGHGRWAEDGAVMKWEIRHPDGSVVTPEELAAARDSKPCKQHHQPRSECKPWDRHGHPMRFRDDTWGDAERAAGARRTDVTTWVTEAMEAAAGYVRCQKCPLDDNAVPLVLGNLEGKPFGEWIAEAVKEAARQHPAHESVRIGAGMPAGTREDKAVPAGKKRPAARTEPPVPASAAAGAELAATVALLKRKMDESLARDEPAARARKRAPVTAPGTAVFLTPDPDAEAVSSFPVPEVPDRRSKRGGR